MISKLAANKDIMNHEAYMDGLRNHGPLGLDMLKAPPPCEKKYCALAKHARTHKHH